MIINTNIMIIIMSFAVAVAAIYILYSIILYQGNGKPGEDLQLSTKNILEQVKILFDKKEFILVELLASKYLDRVPGHTDVRIYLAKAYYEDKKYNQSIQQCQLVLMKKPNNVDTHLTLARCYHKKRFWNKAIHEYEIVYEQRKTDKDIIRTIAELYNDTEQTYMSINYYNLLVDLVTTDEENADLQSILAELNIEAHDYPAAFEAYKTRLGIYPKDVDTNKKLAELYIKIGNYPVAIETLLYMTEFVTEPKVILWTYELLVDLYEETGDYEKAVEFSEKLLNIQGSDKFKYRNKIALFNLKLDKVNDGILILEDLVLMTQNGLEVTIQLADAYIQNKEYQKALDKYLILLDKAMPKEAKQINLLICDLYIKWAVDLTSQNHYEEAFSYLDNAIQYNAINSEIYYNKAKIHYILGTYNSVVEDINQAIEFCKEDDAMSKYLLLLSQAQHELGNFFEEKKALTDLLKTDSQNPEGLLRLGIMYASQSDVKKAEETLKKALANNPDLVQAKYQLALLYENNNRDKAKELYMEVLEQDPSFTEARNALADMSTS